MITNSQINKPIAITRIAGNFLKNVFDAACALLGLIILSPFLAIIAFMIKRDSPGPVFYWSHTHRERGAGLQNAEIQDHV